MAIYRILNNSTLEPEEISRIAEAYEQALHTLCVKDRDDPLREADHQDRASWCPRRGAAFGSGGRRTTHPVRPPLLAAPPGSTPEEQQHDPPHPRGIFHQVDRLE